METARFWGIRLPSSINNNNNTDRQSSPSTNRAEELATENTSLLTSSASERMNASMTEQGSEAEESSDGTHTSTIPQGGDRAALLQETDVDSENNANTTPTTGNDPPRVEDSIIINLTNRLRCLFACLTVPIFPLGILLFIFLVRLLYCAFVKDISDTCTHPLKLYAVMSLALSSYFPQHKRVKTFLFGYQRERDGPVRPRSVRIYDQLFHLLVLNYVYFGMILVQSCKDDPVISDDASGSVDEDPISTCEQSCPSLYAATRSYVLILQVLVIVFLLPLVCLPFIYLWIVRRVTTEEAWARFGRVAAGEEEEEGGSVTAKEILEQMNEVVLIHNSGEEGLIKVAKKSSGNDADLEEGGDVSSVEHQSLEWKLVKDCCICQDEFDVFDETDYLAQTSGTRLNTTPDLDLEASDTAPLSMSPSPQSGYIPKKEDVIVQTKCGHLFHKECIGPWIYGPWTGDESSRPLNSRAARKCCPLCRRDLTEGGPSD